jgi:hypothetical protein
MYPKHKIPYGKLKYEFDRIDQKINLEKFNYRKMD